jgi:hypothetical protein
VSALLACIDEDQDELCGMEVQHKEKQLVEKQLRPRYGDAWRKHHGEAKYQPLTHQVGGFCGYFGRTVNSQQFYQEEIANCEEAIDRARNDIFTSGIANSFFVIFDSQVGSCLSLYVLYNAFLWFCMLGDL